MTNTIDELLAAMTIDEKVAMAAGSGVWHSTGVDRLGVPRMKVTDGPNGARGDGAGSMTSACFPCGTALGATWDIDLVREVGAAIGDEVRSKGAHLLLAPTMNLHRTPLGGRNFECFSEDPLLTGVLASAYVEGVQSTGVGATVKHFVANDSEFERHTIDCVIDERTLREVYLLPFEMTVRDVAPVSVMSSYNRINGVSASDHRELLTGILKAEWGYDGFVISDWFGTRTTVGAANAGLDLEMPGPARVFGEQLLAAAERGEVSEAVIDDKVRRLLGALERTGAFERADEPETSRDDPSHRATARAAASAATVMVRNTGLLPLDASLLRSVAVIGPNAAEARIQGGGSAGVSPHYVVSPLDGIRAALGPDVEVRHEPGCNIDQKLPMLDLALVRPPGTDRTETGRWHAEFRRADDDPAAPPRHVRTPRHSRFVWMGTVLPKVPTGDISLRLSATLRSSTGGRWSFGLISAGRSRLWIDGALVVDAWAEWAPGSEFYGNGCDEVIGEFELEPEADHDIVVEFTQDDHRGEMAAISIGARPPVPDDLLERAEQAARDANAVVMIVGQNSDWETEGRDREFLELPGDQPELIRRIGAANPRTAVFVNAGSPVDMSWADTVASILYNWYPGQENGNSIADIVFGASDPGGRLPMTLPVRMQDTPSFGNYPGEFGQVRYGEGLLIGHRWYDTRDIAPAFPFGHGLSHTTFDWELQDTDGPRDDGPIIISVQVTNSGSHAGSDVIQVYAHRPQSAVSRPEQQLVAFAKVHLDPGESAVVPVMVPADRLRHWNPSDHCWDLESGEIELRVSRDSRSPVATITVEAPTAF